MSFHVSNIVYCRLSLCLLLLVVDEMPGCLGLVNFESLYIILCLYLMVLDNAGVMYMY